MEATRSSRLGHVRPLRILKIVVMVALAITVFGLVVQHLWNWLVPAVFGWKPISFVQALGLLILSKILFGGIHRHVGAGGRRRWKRNMGARWAAMSPEERERFRAGLREHGPCRWDRAGWSRNAEKPGTTPEQTAS